MRLDLVTEGPAYLEAGDYFLTDALNFELQMEFAAFRL